MSNTHPTNPADQAAAEAVVRHHAELAATLVEHVTQLLVAVESGSSQSTWSHRDRLAAWLHDELLPHAHGEEATMYPAAAAQPGGALLIEGILGEHRAIVTLAAELEVATSPVRAAATAGALQAVFTGHLAKENDLVLPLLLGAGDVSLAGLLNGMHEILGAQPGPAAGDGGCGCGDCGCGGETAGAASGVQAVTIDT